MKLLLFIAAGGAIGAVLRHAMNNFIIGFLGNDFPWGIFIINILGSFFMGVAVAVFAGLSDISDEMKTLVMVGVLGSFTTFSTFSHDVLILFERGAVLSAAGYIIGSVVIAISALFIGMLITKALVV